MEITGEQILSKSSIAHPSIQLAEPISPISRNLQIIQTSEEYQFDYNNYYDRLRSLVEAKESSKEAKELIEILKTWKHKPFEDLGENEEDLFDGDLEIQIYDVKTCRMQNSM